HRPDASPSWSRTRYVGNLTDAHLPPFPGSVGSVAGPTEGPGPRGGGHLSPRGGQGSLGRQRVERAGGDGDLLADVEHPALGGVRLVRDHEVAGGQAHVVL